MLSASEFFFKRRSALMRYIDFDVSIALYLSHKSAHSHTYSRVLARVTASCGDKDRYTNCFNEANVPPRSVGEIRKTRVSERTSGRADKRTRDHVAYRRAGHSPFSRPCIFDGPLHPLYLHERRHSAAPCERASLGGPRRFNALIKRGCS